MRALLHHPADQAGLSAAIFLLSKKYFRYYPCPDMAPDMDGPARPFFGGGSARNEPKLNGGPHSTANAGLILIVNTL